MLTFDEQWSAAQQRLDVVFGEDFRLEPYKAPTVNGRPDVNGRAVVDDARPPSIFRATYRDIGAKQNAKGRSMADSTTRTVAADGPHLRLTPVEGADRPTRGDRIVRMKTGERFLVGNILARGRAGLQVTLSVVGP